MQAADLGMSRTQLSFLQTTNKKCAPASFQNVEHDS